MIIVTDTLQYIITLFENPYMFSLLGLIGLSLVILAIKILCKF